MKKAFLGIAMSLIVLAACNQNKGNGSSAEGDSTATSAAAPVDSANAPVLKFEEEIHNFGAVKEGDKVDYAFKFTNTGKSPLLISNASATCGCTVPEWPKTPIKPNESSEIKVTFNSAGKNGIQDKLITVTANTVPAQTVVHLAGEVVKK